MRGAADRRMVGFDALGRKIPVTSLQWDTGTDLKSEGGDAAVETLELACGTMAAKAVQRAGALTWAGWLLCPPLA